MILDKVKALPLPIKLCGGAAVLLFAYLAITGGVSTMWARHIANQALRGIAATISDIDKVEGEAAAKEQAIEALARQTQELEAKAETERKLRLEAEAEAVQLRQKVTEAHAAAEHLRQADLNRVPVSTLEGARDAINRALARRHQ